MSTTTDVLVNVALTTAPLFAGALFAYGRRWLIAHNYKTDMFDLVAKGAGAAYGFLVVRNQRITDPNAVSAALRYGMSVVLESPDIKKKMDTLGYSADFTQRLINAELGKLAARDPTISVAANALPALVEGVTKDAVAAAFEGRV